MKKLTILGWALFLVVCTGIFILERRASRPTMIMTPVATNQTVGTNSAKQETTESETVPGTTNVVSVTESNGVITISLTPEVSVK